MTDVLMDTLLRLAFDKDSKKSRRLSVHIHINACAARLYNQVIIPLLLTKKASYLFRETFTVHILVVPSAAITLYLCSFVQSAGTPKAGEPSIGVTRAAVDTFM